MDKIRTLTLYTDSSINGPADLQNGEVVRVVRGDGPRDGDFMGLGTIVITDEGVGLNLTFAPRERAV